MVKLLKRSKKEEKEKTKTKKKAPATDKKQSVQPITPKKKEIIQFVLMTEKAIQSIETQNQLVFVVAHGTNKTDIKNSVEKMFNSKIKSVRTVIDQKGRKKALVKFEKDGEAGEIAIRLGVI